MKINIKEINGNEIIKYLNSLKDDDMDDIAIVLGSFVFESQSVKYDTYQYTLSFTASYNNWGTNQEIPNNYMVITEDYIFFSLEEPFDGDDTSDVLTNHLLKWLETHKFEDQTELFYNKLQDVYEQIPQMSFSDVKKMGEIIETLTELKSMMKE